MHLTGYHDQITEVLKTLKNLFDDDKNHQQVFTLVRDPSVNERRMISAQLV
jgi:hypothetical protein